MYSFCKNALSVFDKMSQSWCFLFVICRFLGYNYLMFIFFFFVVAEEAKYI